MLHSTFDKLLHILYLQGSLVQTEVTRYSLEYTFNSLISTAQNQNYDHRLISLDQLVDIYLGF